MEERCTKEKELATLQEQIKAIFKRMDEQTQLAKSFNELITEIKIMNIEMKGIKEAQVDFKEEVKSIRADLEDIKSKPGKNWEWLKGLVGGTVISAIMALVLKAIGLI